MYFVSVFLLAMLTGCSWLQSPEGGGMEVSVVLRSVHRCSRISPEIEIYRPPPGTVRFDVLLEDRTDPRKMHGGGIWENDGTGIIPEGGLNRHYLGACPPQGTSRSYQYVVTALDVNNKPLMTRHYIFEQE